MLQIPKTRCVLYTRTFFSGILKAKISGCELFRCYKFQKLDAYYTREPFFPEFWERKLAGVNYLDATNSKNSMRIIHENLFFRNFESEN